MALSLKKVLKSFTKTLDQLEQIVKANDQAIAENTAQIDRIRDTNLDLMAERQQARNVSDNLRKLLES